MNDTTEIALVYLGAKLPKYARLNIKQLETKFPSKRIVLISDIVSNSKYIKRGSFFLVPNSKSLWPQLYATLGHDINFRKSFWFNTVIRFKALELYMETFNSQRLLQFELDNWINEEFPFQTFSSLNSEIAFTLESSNVGSAAILFLQDTDSAKKLCSITESISANDPFSTDMTILGKIHQEKLMNCQQLPSLPNQIELQTEIFGNAIFDPNSWGMYLFGMDPRNFQGKVIMGRSQSHHFIDGKNYSYGASHGNFFVKNSKTTSRLMNLHIHSKNTQIFRNEKKSSTYMKKKFNEVVNQEQHQFNLTVFLQLVMRKISKSMKLKFRSEFKS